MKLRSLLAQFLLTTVSTSSLMMFAANQAAAQTVTNASDNAGNYPGGWTNGANGGTGFGAWAVTSSTNTNGSAGAFIGNPTNAGITTNAVFGAQAFGLYANPEATGVFVNTDRTFPLLQVGQTFSFQWAVNYESGGGNKGFNVYSGGTGGAQIANVNQGGPPGDITLNGSNAITNYGTAPMTWSFTRTAPNNLLVTSTPRDGSTNIAYSTNITISAAPDAIRWYAANLSASFKDERQPYFNNLLIAGPAPVTNQVTFTVNMAYQASQGLFSTNNSDTVQVLGDFNNWNTNSNSIYALTNQGNNIFGGTFPISATEGTPLNYKFWNSATNAPNSGFESGANRVFTMGANGTTNTLPVVYFSNLAGERFVTFSVNMAIQEGKGAFNPATNGVIIAGSFNNWNTNSNSIYALTNQGNNIYSGSFLLSASTTNSTQEYKYFATGTNAVGYESAFNRPFDLVFNTDGSNSPALVLATNYFSNELFYVTGTPLNAFSTTQGTASSAQSVTVNGQGLTADVSVVAPTGFEISTNGASYVGSLSIAPISNTISAATLYTRIAASAAVGSPAGNVDLTSTGSQSVNIAVSGTVNASGQTFANWSGGLSNTPTLQLQYAIGGASSPTATNGVPSVTTVTSNALAITAIVRTNDPNLSVVGQAVIDLSAGVWSTNDVTMTPGDQTGVGEGLQKQIWSVPRSSDTKKFLRLRTVLTNQ
jgi:hypothetical protein